MVRCKRSLKVLTIIQSKPKNVWPKVDLKHIIGVDKDLYLCQVQAKSEKVCCAII